MAGRRGERRGGRAGTSCGAPCPWGDVASPAIDPELEALPEPRRPWRRATLVVLALTTALSLALGASLRGLAGYALRGEPPREVGALTHVQLAPDLEGTWVHGTGRLGPRALEYRRPLDADHFRLAPVEGSDALFIELRVPAGLEPEHYVPPNSFVGRLVPLGRAGLRHGALPAELGALGADPGSRAWVLVDGEAPATTRWAAGLLVLFLGFAAFGVFGLVVLLRRPLPSG